jgi:hypothetical protein
MNRKSIPKSWLLGGAAAAAILVGGIGLYSVFSPRAEPAAAEGGEAEQGEEGHAEDAGGGEGVVVLTPAQIQAASIAVVAARPAWPAASSRWSTPGRLSPPRSAGVLSASLSRLDNPSELGSL